MNKWLNWPDSPPCADKYLATGAILSNDTQYVASNCMVIVREELLRTYNRYFAHPYADSEDCIDVPLETSAVWTNAPGPPVAVVTNQLEVGMSGLPRGMAAEDQVKDTGIRPYLESEAYLAEALDKSVSYNFLRGTFPVLKQKLAEAAAHCAADRWKKDPVGRASRLAYHERLKQIRAKAIEEFPELQNPGVDVYLPEIQPLQPKGLS